MSIRNVFREITSYSVLLKAESEVSANKKENRERLVFYDDLEMNIRDLSEMLRSGRIPKVYYRSFFVYDPKVRKVIFIDYRSKIVQRAIYDVLNPKICKMFIKDTYACIEGRGQLAAMQKLYSWFQDVRTSGETWYYYKFDVARFFYRIDHEILMQILEKKISDKAAVAMIRYYVDNNMVPFGMPIDADPLTVSEDEMLFDIGIPIGGGLSHMLANMYLNELDQFVKRVLGVKRYIRYMDDIILMDNDKELLKEYGRRMDEFIRSNLHLEFNRKTALRPCWSGCEFVGYVIFPDHVILRKQTTLHISRTFRRMMEGYRTGELQFSEIRTSVCCYIAMMDKCNCTDYRNNLFENFVLTHADPDDEEEPYDSGYCQEAMVVGL